MKVIKVKTQNSTEQTESPQRPKLTLLPKFKLVKSKIFVPYQNKTQGITIRMGWSLSNTG